MRPILNCNHHAICILRGLLQTSSKACPYCRNPGGTNDTALAVHPGLVDTQLARQWITGEDVWGAIARPVLAPLMRALAPWVLVPPRTAVETLLYAATTHAEEVPSFRPCMHGALIKGLCSGGGKSRQ